MQDVTDRKSPVLRFAVKAGDDMADYMSLLRRFGQFDLTGEPH